MIVVHHLENSRSQRILWLLEELDLPYDLKRYPRDPATMLAPPALKAIHPLGKSPVITDGDRTLAESGAITEYLVETFGEGRLVPPEGSDARLRWRFWLHYAEGSAMPPLLLKLLFGQLPRRSPWPMRPLVGAIAKKVEQDFIGPQLRLHMDHWESELRRSPFFAGEAFTAADIMMSFPVEAAEARVGFGPDRPKLAAWLEQVQARPAWQRALERGGPYELIG